MVEEGGGKRLRALLVEDDPADAALVTRLLRRARPDGFEVVVAGRIGTAVATLAADPLGFDVVLSDLGLPDSFGIATLDALTRAAPALPVVVLTGQDDESLALDAVRRGAQDYLVKGGDGAVLSRVVRYAIERKATEAALREARDAAEQAARAKSVFLAMMGHEIRTPLNGVLGMARLLLETPLVPDQRAHVDTLVSSGELLLGLVNDLLDFARLEADGLTLELEPFDLAGTVEEVRLVLAARAADKNLLLTCRLAPGCPRRVHGDRLRLRQILFNLVGNAIKFTDAGSVTLTVEPASPSPRLRFVVADTGIGIPPEVGPALFEEFWQGADHSTRRCGGAGLGLAICRRLCRLMGGEIGYDSVPGRGSLFRVELPLPEACGGEDPPVPPPPGAGPSRRILLADDNPVNRAVATGLLERRGHLVTAVADGAAAVSAALATRFDLILLDWRMPGMDGVAAARAIRAQPGGEAAPLYLLTANPSPEVAEQCRAAGGQGTLAKPFRVEAVLRLLAGAGPPLPPPLVALADLAIDRHDLGAERMTGLLGLFQRSSGADLDRLLAQVAAGTLAEAGASAHRMAGAAASLHLRPLSERCRDLEAAARRGDATAVTALATDLAALWHASVEALARALA